MYTKVCNVVQQSNYTARRAFKGIAPPGERPARNKGETPWKPQEPGLLNLRKIHTGQIHKCQSVMLVQKWCWRLQ